ncbi:hypothetical protein [Bacillus toyonensis]|uniref:hypothetical protein n=1 Tax=Bacillus toyonensis TaxID=155322 RepID=UPI00111BFCDD|nr:hypothetical protein [Bacillus toyonensis]
MKPYPIIEVEAVSIAEFAFTLWISKGASRPFLYLFVSGDMISHSIYKSKAGLIGLPLDQ